MNRPVSGIFSAALAFPVALSGCSTKTLAPGPTTEATDPITETETMPRQIVVTDPPKGWSLAYPRTPYDTIVARESYKQRDQEGVSIGSFSNDELRKYGGPLKFSPETEKPDADVHRDAWLTSIGTHDRYTGDARSMGFQTIGGEYVVDSAYIVTTRKGGVHACQFWMVGCPEGSWDFYVCSTPGETDIVPELLTTLEAIRWVDTPPAFSCSKAEGSNYPC